MYLYSLEHSGTFLSEIKHLSIQVPKSNVFLFKQIKDSFNFILLAISIFFYFVASTPSTAELLVRLLRCNRKSRGVDLRLGLGVSEQVSRVKGILFHF
jgi:hypothetical protein